MRDDSQSGLRKLLPGIAGCAAVFAVLAVIWSSYDDGKYDPCQEHDARKLSADDAAFARVARLHMEMFEQKPPHAFCIGEIKRDAEGVKVDAVMRGRREKTAAAVGDVQVIINPETRIVEKTSNDKERP